MITYFVLSQSTKQLYENKEIITNEQVEEKPLWMRDEDAVDAAKAVIRKKELEAENVNLTAEVKKLTEIYEQEIKMREERQKEIEKELGIYWRSKANLKALVREKANAYGVSAELMEEIISCESHWEYSIQSRHFYNKKNVPIGYTVGMREESWGLVQIHLPAHPKISKEQAINPDFAIDFLAKNLSRGKAKMWSCYKLLAQK